VDYYVFLQWMNPLSVNFAESEISSSQELGAVLAGITGLAGESQMHFILGTVVSIALLIWAFKSADFRSRFDNILGGAVIGLAVVCGWYITAGPLGQEWLGEIEWLDIKPAATGAQSYTFVAPPGHTFNWLTSAAKPNLITFAMMGMAGVAVGSFIWAIVSRRFRFEWFVSVSDFVRHVIGGVLMGVGGVLAMGCTIGQGVTGFSTLAIGSILAFGSIIFGAAITMKVQYYKMVYEDEASFTAALASALVDMHLLPNGLRKLEAV
jgi:hypothetical protein